MIAPQPFFTPRGTPLSVYYRLLALSELGHTVDLMTWPAGRNIAIPNVHIIRPPALSFIKTVKAGPSLTKLFLDMVLFPMAFFRAARNPGRYHCLFVHEEAVAAGLVMKKVFGIPLIYDMHSSLAAQFESFDYANLAPIKRLFALLEKAALARADCVLTICPDLDQRVRAAGCDRAVLIPNFRLDPVPEPRATFPMPAAFSRAQAFAKKAPDETLLFYGGTLEPYQGIDLMLEAFKIIAAKNRRVKLLVVGGTANQVQKVKSNSHPLLQNGRLFFTGTLNPGAAADLMAQADILLSPRTRGTNTPLKLYAYMASGIPLVATRIYSHTQELDADHAFLADPTPDAFAAAIARCMADRDEAGQKAKNARALYERKFGPDRYRRQIESALLLLDNGD
ncbi:MAG: glycosyltransferase [Thermodesulfobacteriota bacterium]